MKGVIDNMSIEELDSLLSGKNFRKIKFDVCFNRPNNFIPKQISFDEINSYDFSKGFTEYLISEDMVHLYFDFDSISSEDEFLSVFNWLESLSSVFGKFSYGGYCNNDEMQEIGFRRFDEGDHYLSMHVVFYETAIKTVDLQKIMKHTEKKGFSTKGVHKLCDPNVYKLVSKKEGQTIRQLFRHVLADKIYKIGDPKNKLNHGFICEDGKPFMQIVQVRGDEKVIERCEWSKLFEVKDLNNCAVENVNVEKVIPAKDDDIEVNNELIKLTDVEIIELFNNFEPTYENFTSIISNFIHSPYELVDVKRLIEKWYFKGEHQNQNTIELFVDKYYEKIDNNKWLFSIIKHLPSNRRTEYLENLSSKAIDTEAKIDFDDNFSLKDIRENDYRLNKGVGINVNQFLNDLKKCVAIINSAQMLFVVKDYEPTKDEKKLSFLDSHQFKDLMNSINIGKYYKEGKIKNVNAFQIYNTGKNKNWLMKDGMRFYDERDNLLSFFRGYEYRKRETVDMKKIQAFLNHIKEVIANGNEEMYEYLLNWYAYILQNPAGKTGTCIVITGIEGAGKGTFFTDVLCKLMSKYANKNITNMDSVVGKFNPAPENKKLLVCNEASSAEKNKFTNFDALKSLITEDQIDINQKNEKIRTVQNVCNLIIVSNHFAPVKITKNDRRYVVTEVSEKYKNNWGYFGALANDFDQDFYENLYTFFMDRDLSSFNPRILPKSEIKDAIVDSFKSSYQAFYESFEDAFDEGWICGDCYQSYVQFAKSNGFSVCASNTFGGRMREFVIRKQTRLNGERQWVYIKKEA